MRVGNDIVDLTDPDNKGKSRDSRYASRVFTPAERKRIESFPEPDVLLWALWAGKEAAFKVLAKKNPALPFIPRNYEVHLDDYGLRGTSTDAGTCNPHVEGAVLTPEGAVPLRFIVAARTFTPWPSRKGRSSSITSSGGWKSCPS